MPDTNGAPAQPEAPAPSGSRRLYGAARVVMVLACLAMVVGFFLPYISTTGSERARLLDNPDETYSEELNMTNGQAVDMSLMEYARIYWYAGHEYNDGYLENFGAIVALGAAELLALILALAKKPAPALVFSLASLGLMLLLNRYFEYTGIVGGTPLFGSPREWSSARIVLFAGAGAASAASVCMMTARASVRRAAKRAGSPQGRRT